MRGHCTPNDADSFLSYRLTGCVIPPQTAGVPDVTLARTMAVHIWQVLVQVRYPSVMGDTRLAMTRTQLPCIALYSMR